MACSVVALHSSANCRAARKRSHAHGIMLADCLLMTACQRSAKDISPPMDPICDLPCKGCEIVDQSLKMPRTRMASAASTVTWSSVASRCSIPRSKYTVFRSRNGKMSCGTPPSHSKLHKKSTMTTAAAKDVLDCQMCGYHMDPTTAACDGVWSASRSVRLRDHI